MKRTVIAIAGVLVLYLSYVIVSLALLPPVADLANRKSSVSIQVKDWQGAYHPYIVGPKNRYWTPSGSIPPEMKWSVILAEDANFYKHEGIDVKAIKNAIKYDLEKKSFAKGASTLTQQVAKNIYLSREKTITRKLKEVYLALRMEQELTKGRIVELYLNVVELGPMVYGIGHGSRYYFGKHPSELTPRECAFLAAMLPGPRLAYNPYRNMSKVLRRSDMILKLLKSKGVLGEAEYRAALAEAPNIAGLQRKVEESIKREESFKPMSSIAPQASPSPEPSPAEKPSGAVSDQAEEQPAEPKGGSNPPIENKPGQ
jgi:monofunctional biosynthetic peptidoglycan transglycosylase